jgi:ribonuclease VapC
MHVDASAITAMICGEDDAASLLARLQTHPSRKSTPLAVWETTVAVARNLGLGVSEAEIAVEEFLALMGITVIDVPAAARAGAISAYDRFGKSRHRAALNFGDCFAYASAKLDGEPLLYKGDDFPHTDIRAA